jgi:hypothetical protein
VLLAAFAPLASNALTTKLAVPEVVGVPASDPEVVRDSPPGKAPWVTRTVYGPRWPLTLMVCEYAVPTVAAGNVLGEIVAAGAAIAAPLSSTPRAAAAGTANANILLMQAPLLDVMGDTMVERDSE